MGLESALIPAIATASLGYSAYSSYAQYQQGKKIEERQNLQQSVQQRIQNTENRRETIKQQVRARVLRARALAQAEARGAGGDSGSQSQVGGIASTVAGQIGRENTARLRGAQMSLLNRDIAQAEGDISMLQATQGIANSLFEVTGGSLFD